MYKSIIKKEIPSNFALMFGIILIILSLVGIVGNDLQWQHGEIKNITIENKTSFISSNGIIIPMSICARPTCYQVNAVDGSWYYVNSVSDYTKMEINKSYIVSIAHNDDIQIFGPEHTHYIEGIYYG